MRIRPVHAATTAVLFAALAVLSAPAASAVTIDGHEMLPLSVVGPTANSNIVNYVDYEAVTIADPGDCPTGSDSVLILSLPGQYNKPGGKIATRPMDNGGIIAGNNMGIGRLLVAEPGMAGALDTFKRSHDTYYWLSISCWTNPTTEAPGAPVWLTTLKKLSLAEEAAAHLDSQNSGGAYMIIPFVVPPAQTAPAAPVRVVVTPGVESLTASWPTVYADPAVTGYQVSVTAGGAPIDGSPFPADATATSTVVDGLTGRTAYTVTVKATNSVGDGAASPPATVTALPWSFGLKPITAEVVVPAPSNTITMSVSATGTASLGTAVEQDDGSFTATGTLGDVTVTEDRAGLSSNSGWQLRATVADFTGSTAGSGFSFAQLGSTPKLGAGTLAMGPSGGSGVIAGPAEPGGAAPALRFLASSGSSTNQGHSGIVNADLSLVVPKNTPDGTYSTTITVDLIKF
jgi:Fibronectin type III domain